MAKMECTTNGGVVSGTCPTSGLLGCCNMSPGKTCLYQGGPIDAATGQMGCTQQGGTWTTTP
jgi:hypothetical protein